MGWVVNTPPPPISPGQETRYPLYRRLSGPQWRSGRVRKISPTTEIRSPDRPARSEYLYRLSYPGTPTLHVHCLTCLILYFRVCISLSFTKHFRSESVEWSYFTSSGVRTGSAEGISGPQAARLKSCATM